MLGQILSVLDKAINLANDMSKSLTALYNALNGLTVYFEADLGEPITIGRFSYISNSLFHIGLKNIFIDIGLSFFNPYTKGIDFTKYNPDVIIYERGYATKVNVEDVRRMFINCHLDYWDAVKHSRIIVLEDNSLTHYGPSIVDTLSRLVYEIGELL